MIQLTVIQLTHALQKNMPSSDTQCTHTTPTGSERTEAATLRSYPRHGQHDILARDRIVELQSLVSPLYPPLQSPH